LDKKVFEEIEGKNDVFTGAFADINGPKLKSKRIKNQRDSRRLSARNSSFFLKNAGQDEETLAEAKKWGGIIRDGIGKIFDQIETNPHELESNAQEVKRKSRLDRSASDVLRKFE
jgi:hypothetical protein